MKKEDAQYLFQLSPLAYTAYQAYKLELLPQYFTRKHFQDVLCIGRVQRDEALMVLHEAGLIRRDQYGFIFISETVEMKIETRLPEKLLSLFTEFYSIKKRKIINDELSYLGLMPQSLEKLKQYTDDELSFFLEQFAYQKRKKENLSSGYFFTAVEGCITDESFIRHLRQLHNEKKQEKRRKERAKVEAEKRRIKENREQQLEREKHYFDLVSSFLEKNRNYASRWKNEYIKKNGSIPHKITLITWICDDSSKTKTIEKILKSGGQGAKKATGQRQG